MAALVKIVTPFALPSVSAQISRVGGPLYLALYPSLRLEKLRQDARTLLAI